uniref:Arginine deiminase n=1 Tax=Lacusteria cypriaca TaxID=929580 RepID=A0A142D9X8_9EUKA|nr:arginine deiminase [Lacusteria cypriaca]
MLNKACGAKVWTVREILNDMSISQLRNSLIDMTPVKFSVSPGDITPDIEAKMKRDYIDFSLSRLSKDHLIDLIFLHPSVYIDVIPGSSTGFNYSQLPLAPLANTVFTRDQQITTAKGVVIGRFGAQQRLSENDLMEIVWPQLGIKPIGRIEAPGTIEGGDFIPLSTDCMLLGTGLRTNMSAAMQLMNRDLLGCNRFIVIEDLCDLNQQRMHLDTYFNVASEKLCVCIDAIAQDNPKYLRIAREFVKRGPSGYTEERAMPFGQWLKKEGFEVIEASFKQQEEYFINLLHLGKNAKGKDIVFSINPEVESSLRKRGFDGEVHYLDFSPITAMYGGAHCASQVLRSPK